MQEVWKYSFHLKVLVYSEIYHYKSKEYVKPNQAI